MGAGAREGGGDVSAAWFSGPILKAYRASWASANESAVDERLGAIQVCTRFTF